MLGRRGFGSRQQQYQEHRASWYARSTVLVLNCLASRAACGGAALAACSGASGTCPRCEPAARICTAGGGGEQIEVRLPEVILPIHSTHERELQNAPMGTSLNSAARPLAVCGTEIRVFFEQMAAFSLADEDIDARSKPEMGSS